MTLKEILAENGNPHTKIEYRVFYQLPDLSKNTELVIGIINYKGVYYQDTLFGFCEYDPEENDLISLDGDSYSLNAPIVKYVWTDPNNLTVWEEPSEQIQNWNDYRAGYDDGIKKAKKMLLEHVNKEYIEYSRNRFLFDVNKIWEKIKNDIK